MKSAHWFASPSFDLGFFHLPVWLIWALIFLLPASILATPVPLWAWLLAVVLLDVGHVWASIYRTYLDPITRKHQHRTLLLTPLLCFVGCFSIAYFGDLSFWRALAYVAAYHFVKQQVGICALYGARFSQHLGDVPGNSSEDRARLRKWDNAAIYAGTVCPLLWWHAHLPRKFEWFVDNDFLNPTGFLQALPSPVYMAGSFVFYLVWIGSLVGWFVVHVRHARSFNLPLPLGKFLWVIGTAINWYLGLVHFDSSLVFTLTNVVAHGAPYYGLIALHQGRIRKQAQPRASHRRIVFTVICLFLPILCLAMGEEFLWDFLLYRDRPQFFSSIIPYWREMVTHPLWRAFWIALLSLPQTVHYVLDGFIWKMDGRNPDLRPALFPSIDPDQNAPRFA